MTLRDKGSYLQKIRSQGLHGSKLIVAWLFKSIWPRATPRERILLRRENVWWEIHLDQRVHSKSAFSSSPVCRVENSVPLAWRSEDQCGAAPQFSLRAQLENKLGPEHEQALVQLPQPLLTALPEPCVLARSLRIPPCSLGKLPACIARRCERDWPEVNALCATFAIWGKRSHGWIISVFAAKEAAIGEHFSSLSKLGLQPDLCAPESLALGAYFEKNFPEITSAIFAHVEPTYCTLLLLVDKEIVGQQVVLGSFTSKDPFEVEVQVRLRQAFRGLRNRLVESKQTQPDVSCKRETGCKPDTHPIYLLCTGLQAPVNWLSLARVQTDSRDDLRLLAAPLSAKWAVAEGLIELSRRRWTSPAQLAPRDLPAISLFARCPFLKRSLWSFALSFCFILGMLSLVQCRRVSSQAKIDFAKLALKMGSSSIYEKIEPNLNGRALEKDTLRALEKGTLRALEKGTLETLKRQLGVWNECALIRSAGSGQVLQWLWQSAGNHLDMGLALRKLEICAEKPPQAFAGLFRVSFTLSADPSVDTRKLVSRLRQWGQIDRNLPENWRARRGYIIADFYLKKALQPNCSNQWIEDA